MEQSLTPPRCNFTPLRLSDCLTSTAEWGRKAQSVRLEGASAAGVSEQDMKPEMVRKTPSGDQAYGRLHRPIPVALIVLSYNAWGKGATAPRTHHSPSVEEKEMKGNKLTKEARKTRNALRKEARLLALKDCRKAASELGEPHIGSGYVSVANGLQYHRLIEKVRWFKPSEKVKARNVILKYAKSKGVYQPATTRKQESKNFLESWEWRTLRYKVIQQYGRKCMCCGATPDDGTTIIHVDHIKPRHTHPELALERTNLQVLCGVCNQGKGAWDDTDFRKTTMEK